MERDLELLTERFLVGYGIADCSLRSATAKIPKPYRDGDPPFKVVDMTSDIRVALEYLSVLSWPPTRHVAFSAGSSCTAFVNNSRNGSDYADHKVWMALHLESRFARIIDRPSHKWSNGSERITLRYEATIFELFASTGDLIRSVICMNDGGRWFFGEAGGRHPVEDGFPYDERRKRDRFGTPQLRRLAAAFDIPTLKPRDFTYARQYLLFESSHEAINTCTLAEADDPAYGYYLRGLGWLRHIETHASSVVADFERCLQLNPAYETRVRPDLDRAYKILASQEHA